jgi:hypothetical protein
MELVLNLAWMVLTALMFWLWLRHAPRKGASRTMQIVALATVFLILLPAISVTDDLVMAQNPAETDRCQRKDERAAVPHAAHFPVADFIPAFSTEIRFDSSHFAVLGNLLAPAAKVPAMDSIQNRPPPAA